MNQSSKILIVRITQLITIGLIISSIGKIYPLAAYLTFNILGALLLLFALYRKGTAINLESDQKLLFILTNILLSGVDILLFILLRRTLDNILIVVFLAKALRYSIEKTFFSYYFNNSNSKRRIINNYPLNIAIELRWYLKKLMGKIGQQYFRNSSFTQQTLINTSYLFRDLNDYSDLLKIYSKNHQKTLAILVAGCATGQEAYSIAAFCNKNCIPVFITAFDLSQKAINIAKEGKFDLTEEKALILRSNAKLSLDHLEIFKDLFYINNQIAIAKPSIKNCIQFSVQDITSINYRNEFDFVFARKMLYYIPENKIDVAVLNLKKSLIKGVYPNNLIIDDYSKKLLKSYLVKGVDKL